MSAWKPDRYRVEDRGYTTPCWIWNLAVNDSGYGVVGQGGKMLRAHRVYYEKACGPIPSGLVLDHLCRVRSCVNPDHLEPVTRGENVMRGSTLPALNATKTHCPNNHPYDEANTRINKRGSRSCRACDRERAQALRKAAAAASRTGPAYIAHETAIAFEPGQVFEIDGRRMAVATVSPGLVYLLPEESFCRVAADHPWRATA